MTHGTSTMERNTYTVLHTAKINMSETIIWYSVDFRLKMKNSHNVGSNVGEKKCFIKLAHTTHLYHHLTYFATFCYKTIFRYKPL